MVGILVCAYLGVTVDFWFIFVCLAYDKVHLGHWVYVSGPKKLMSTLRKNALSFNKSAVHGI